MLKSQEINPDYILGLIFEHNRQNKGKGEMIEEVKRLIRSSTGNRAKEGTVVDFIQQTNPDDLPDKASIIDAFFTFAQREQQREAEALIKEENLNEEAAKRYIRTSLKREYATENGTELNETLPRLSPLNPQYKTKKQTVFQKLAHLLKNLRGWVERFREGANKQVISSQADSLIKISRIWADFFFPQTHRIGLFRLFFHHFWRYFRFY